MNAARLPHPFHGLSAFPPTPADGDGRVHAEALARLVDRLCEAGVDSIGLLGSTGLYSYLGRDERRRAVRAAAGTPGGNADCRQPARRCRPAPFRRVASPFQAFGTPFAE